MNEFNGSPIDQLKQLMERLRHPTEGCPWDREQTFETVAPYTIEEAYEVEDAIARKDPEAICEELGDLLLQIVFHSRICLLYTSPSPRDQRGSRMPSSA